MVPPGRQYLARLVTCPTGCRIYLNHVASMWGINTITIMQGYRKQGVEVTRLVVPLSITSHDLVKELFTYHTQKLWFTTFEGPSAHEKNSFTREHCYGSNKLEAELVSESFIASLVSESTIREGGLWYWPKWLIWITRRQLGFSYTTGAFTQGLFVLW